MADQWVWGVDVAVARLDFAFVDEHGAWQHNALQLRPKLSPAARLAALFNSTRSCVGNFATYFPPLIVYVERPTGRWPNPPLDHATGVACAAIYDALSSLFRFPVSVQLVAVKDWKKTVLSNGNADKALVASWAAQRGYAGVQDGADALAIAACAASECNHGPGPLHPIDHNPEGVTL